MKQARSQLTPATFTIGDRPLCISADPGTMVSAHMPDADECQRYGLTSGTPVLVITRPDGPHTYVTQCLRCPATK